MSKIMAQEQINAFLSFRENKFTTHFQHGQTTKKLGCRNFLKLEIISFYPIFSI